MNDTLDRALLESAELRNKIKTTYNITLLQCAVNFRLTLLNYLHKVTKKPIAELLRLISNPPCIILQNLSEESVKMHEKLLKTWECEIGVNIANRLCDNKIAFLQGRIAYLSGIPLDTAYSTEHWIAGYEYEQSKEQNDKE